MSALSTHREPLRFLRAPHRTPWRPVRPPQRRARRRLGARESADVRLIASRHYLIGGRTRSTDSTRKRQDMWIFPVALDARAFARRWPSNTAQERGKIMGRFDNRTVIVTRFPWNGLQPRTRLRRRG